MFSCREAKKEEPSVTIRTEKATPQSEEEYDSNEEESEIEETEEETDSLPIEN